MWRFVGSAFLNYTVNVLDLGNIPNEWKVAEVQSVVSTEGKSDADTLSKVFVTAVIRDKLSSRNKLFYIGSYIQMIWWIWKRFNDINRDIL